MPRLDPISLDGLHQRPLPEWLAATHAPLSALPLRSLLSGSVYYPASSMDADPVELLAPYFHSFVYADYALSRDDVIKGLARFPGYGVLANRDVALTELAERKWPSTPPAEEHERVRRFMQPPFAVWAVLQKKFDVGGTPLSDRISFLFVGGDGVATFDALYRRKRRAPAAIALIQPGHGFGGNWTDFTDPNGPLAHAVMENQAGQPMWLLEGGTGEATLYQTPCWPDFGTTVWTRPRSGEGTLRLWQRSS